MRNPIIVRPGVPAPIPMPSLPKIDPFDHDLFRFSPLHPQNRGLIGALAQAWNEQFVSQMMGENDTGKVDADEGDKTAADTCVGDCNTQGKDPCEGLRRQLRDHERKLRDYRVDPTKYDNLRFLGKGRDNIIISARVASLEKQINNFEKQLRECERKNGKP